MTDASPPYPIGTAMLIDDEVIDQKMYRRIIKRSGLVGKTLSFRGADHAFDYLRNHPDEQIDLILLDINMPRMSGFEFLERATHDLGPNFAKVCIVMLTTSLDPSDREYAESFDVVRDFLNKPLTIEHLQRIAAMITAEEDS